MLCRVLEAACLGALRGTAAGDLTHGLFSTTAARTPTCMEIPEFLAMCAGPEDAGEPELSRALEWVTSDVPISSFVSHFFLPRPWP